jgi:hypothetical protein
MDMTLGDPGPKDDYTYTGDVNDSSFSMDYYRSKAAEFQAVLNQVDRVAQVSRDLLAYEISTELRGDLEQLLSEFDSRKVVFRATAEAINAGASLINAVGGRFPVLSIPQTLGAAPFVVPAAAVAAIGTAAVLITWGVTWINNVYDRLNTETLLDAVEDPETKSRVAAAALQSLSSARAAAESPVSAIAGVVKWLAVGAGIFLAVKMFNNMQGESRG